MELAKATEGVYDVDEAEESDDEAVASGPGSKKLPERRTTSQKYKAALVLKAVRAFREAAGKILTPSIETGACGESRPEKAVDVDQRRTGREEVECTSDVGTGASAPGAAGCAGGTN